MKKLTLEKASEMMERNGGSLCLRGTNITTLPDNLTVGGSLYLSGTNITTLPDNLTVGGWLYLSGTGITRHKVKCLENGTYVDGRYLYADNILTHIKKKKQAGKYTYYVGKIPGNNVISDGKNFAHCNKWHDGIQDLLFKSAKDRGADQYRNLTLDTVLPHDEMVTMYRVITGACQQGTKSFVESMGGKRKERYTVREAIELTAGQYGADSFRKFFEIE